MIEQERGTDRSLVSVVLPVYNEVDVIERLHRAIVDGLRNQSVDIEILFVNDGSSDGGEELLDRLSENDSRVRVIHFSRNFGHQAAVKAGVDNAKGDALILMDSDMQDDPASLRQFVAKWQEGYQVVYAVRTKRKEAWWKRALFYSFYRVLNGIADTPIPEDAGNFGLVDRSVVDSLTRLGERDYFYPGLRHWVGYKQIGIPVERLARHDEQPRVSNWQLFRLAKTAIFGFSRAPLTFFYLVAFASIFVFLASLIFTLYHRLITGLAIPGWTSITMMASFFGALNALGISVLGEYVVRIYDQVRARPSYIIERESNSAIESSTNKNHSAEAVLDTIADMSLDARKHFTDKTRRPNSVLTSASE